MILWEKPGKPISHAVQRGGNWNNGANAGAMSVNLNNAPSNTNSNIGFRCTSRIRNRKKVMLPDLQSYWLSRTAQKNTGKHIGLPQIEATDLISVLPAQDLSGENFATPQKLLVDVNSARQQLVPMTK